MKIPRTNSPFQWPAIIESSLEIKRMIAIDMISMIACAFLGCLRDDHTEGRQPEYEHTEIQVSN